MSKSTVAAIKPMDTQIDERTASVFSPDRNIRQPDTDIDKKLTLNKPMEMDGLDFLDLLKPETIPAAFFDPQYRGVLNHLSYGNEGKSRGKERSELPQMTEQIITEFIHKIDTALIKSGHLFLWVDKFHFCSGVQEWIGGTHLEIVDLITWNKDRLGMGYRSRRVAEYLIVLQKQPRKAKGVWTKRNIPDVWTERAARSDGTHAKPLGLQAALIEATSSAGDIIIDPAAGTFSVLKSCRLSGRNFLGCDLVSREE